MKAWPIFRKSFLLDSDKYRLFYKKLKLKYKYLTGGVKEANEYIKDLGVRCMNAKRDSNFCYEQLQKITDMNSTLGSSAKKAYMSFKTGSIGKGRGITIDNRIRVT